MGKIANRQSLAILDRGLKSQPFSQFCCIGVFKTNRQSRVSNRSFKSQRRQRFSEGPKGGRRKRGRGRKLSHFSFCCAFRCCVVYSPCFPVWGEEKVMTIYDAGPLAAGPLCGLLIYESRVFKSPAILDLDRAISPI